MPFRIAAPKQRYIKMALYGGQGSGKSFTTLLFAEGLAKKEGKRIAYVDTEHGTDFYAKHVKDRQVHPEAWDFDALYTRSLTEALKELKALKSDAYAVIVIDNITHMWEAAMNAYRGKRTGGGQIPMHAWQSIKKPYKALIDFLMNSPFHVFICGRQGNQFEEDEHTGEIVHTGFKMKAEGETAYEPHILLHLKQRKEGTRKTATIDCWAEKDRTGVLEGQHFQNPNYRTIIEPLLPYLDDDEQAKVQTGDEAAKQDQEAMTKQDEVLKKTSEKHLRMMKAQFELADTRKKWSAVNKLVTNDLKDEMTNEDVLALRAIAKETLLRIQQEEAELKALIPEGMEAVVSPDPPEDTSKIWVRLPDKTPHEHQYGDWVAILDEGADAD